MTASCTSKPRTPNGNGGVFIPERKCALLGYVHQAHDGDHGQDAARSPALMRFATKLAVCSAVVLVAVKTAAYFQTHSVALLSSLIDSALDILASGVNMIAVRHALTPADAQHRFGHGK